MNFDEIIDRRGTHSDKWDMMEPLFGISPDDGIPMWVADMDFRPPQAVTDALKKMTDVGVYGYFGDDSEYKTAIRWWMETRHGWKIDPDWIQTTPGLVNGTAMCVDAFTEPGDGVALFSPVYHAFYRVLKASDRTVTELPLVLRGDRYEMDFAAYEDLMTGREKLLILCSPHNPGGRIWTREELRSVADFARRHNLVLISDEIHNDLVFPGHTHIPMANAAPEISDRLIMMTATTKTFNTAGAHLGNVIIPDDAMRRIFAGRMKALGLSPNAFGMHMVTAAYSPEGAAWVDALMDYLDGNRRLLDDALNAIPGVRSMPLEATYLAWVDFSGTGMSHKEISSRIGKTARIAASPGPNFGTGGEAFMRFNFATPRARVEEAAARLRDAFSDLQ